MRCRLNEKIIKRLRIYTRKTQRLDNIKENATVYELGNITKEILSKENKIYQIYEYFDLDVNLIMSYLHFSKEELSKMEKSDDISQLYKESQALSTIVSANTYNF